MLDYAKENEGTTMKRVRIIEVNYIPLRVVGWMVMKGNEGITMKTIWIIEPAMSPIGVIEWRSMKRGQMYK